MKIFTKRNIISCLLLGAGSFSFANGFDISLTTFTGVRNATPGAASTIATTDYLNVNRANFIVNTSVAADQQKRDFEDYDYSVLKLGVEIARFAAGPSGN